MTNHPEPALSSCPMCEAVLQTRLVAETIPYATPHGEVLWNVQVPYERCPSCGYEGFGEAGERARTDAVYRHLGRLAPWGIVAIRKSLGLTQIAFAERLGVGRASLERWERGGTMQNQSMDNLIRLLSSQTHKEWLDEDRARQAQAAP